MATYRYTPAGTRELDAGRIQTFLATNGVTADVSVEVADDGTVTYVVDSPIDPRTALANYTPTQTVLDKAAAKIAELRPKLVDGTITNAELRQYLLALTALVWQP